MNMQTTIDTTNDTDETTSAPGASWNYTATYSPDDNKLRLYSVRRLDDETYARAKELGFKWAPKQQLFFAPMWTPAREDFLLSLAGEIDDEDKSLVERAEERAERFEDYSDKRANEAARATEAVKAIADHIPFGQPILVGHHSERRARKDAEKIENGMRRAVNLFETSEYWTRRASSALQHAKYKESASVRYRRIKTIEADKRKQQRNIEQAESFLKAYRDPEAATVKMRDGRGMLQALLCSWEGGLSYENQNILEKGEMGLDDALARAIHSHELHIKHAQRWIDHYENRIAYERAMLDEKGGIVAETKTHEKGGAVRCWVSRGSWLYIVKVNKVTLTVLDNWGNGGANFPRNIEFDKINAIMSKTEVDKARAEGRIIERADKTGFSLVEPTAPTQTDDNATAAPEVEATTPEKSELRENVQQIKEALKAGIKPVSAPQLFQTPNALASRVIDEAEPADGLRWLEPSSGPGRLCQAILRAVESAEIVAVEVSTHVARICAATTPQAHVITGDFLEVDAADLGFFDRVVMNPPFENATDIKHIQNAACLLKCGGVLVAICANGPRQQSALAEWARKSGGFYEALPEGTFKESGTNVNTALLVYRA